MRMRLISSLFLLTGLTACASESPWAGWEQDRTSGGAAVASTQTGYKDYTPRPAIESAPLGSTPDATMPAPTGNPYASAQDAPAGAGAPVPLHAGPFAVAAEPVPYSGKPVAQRTLPLALTGTGIAR